MDPLSIISFAGGSLQLLSCGKDLLDLAREIYRSKTGATKSTERAASLMKRSRDLSSAVLAELPVSDAEKQLHDAAGDCERICQDLGVEIRKLTKSKARRSFAVAAYFAVRSRLGKDAIKEVEESLSRCQGQMSMCLLQVMQDNFKDSFSKVLRQNEQSHLRLEAVQQGIDTLRLGLKIRSFDEKVVSQLEELLELGEAHQLRQQQHQFLKALRFSRIDERFSGVVCAHQETFSWMFDRHGPMDDPAKMTASQRMQIKAREEFVPWLENEWTEPAKAVYHILGKPGAGKSTLMKYLYQHEQVAAHLETWAGERKLVLSSFFFWKPGLDVQKDKCGLIRGLLYRILKEAPELIPIAFPGEWRSLVQMQGAPEIPDTQDLDEAFQLLIRSPCTYEGHRFVFFLDGLDEFEDQHQTKYSLATLILEWVNASLGNMKIILSSRHYVEFETRFGSSPGIHLQNLTRPDMEVVVNARLAQVQDFAELAVMDASSLHNISTTILDISQGVFLWVKLMLNVVEASMGQADSWQMLQRKIDSLPTELEELLQRILDEIDESVDEEKAYRTLMVVGNTSIRSTNLNSHLDHNMDECGLRLLWYSFWDDIAQDSDFVFKRSSKTASEAEISSRLSRSRRQVYGVCKGLVDVIHNKTSPTESYLAISHRSIYELLQRPRTATSVRLHTKNFDDQYMRSLLFLASVKLVATPLMETGFFEVQRMIRQFQGVPYGLTVFGLPRSPTLSALSLPQFAEFLDRFLYYFECRQSYEMSIFNDNEETGTGEHLQPSHAVRISLCIARDCLFSEFIVLHKQRYARIFRSFSSTAVYKDDDIRQRHYLPRFPSCRAYSNYMDDDKEEYFIKNARRWLEILEVLGAEDIVRPQIFALYLAPVLCDYIEELSILPATLDLHQPTEYLETTTWRSSLPFASAIFLAFILYGGSLQLSMQRKCWGATGTPCFYLRVTEKSIPLLRGWQKHGRHVGKKGKTRLYILTASMDDWDQEVKFRDLVEMLFAGRALEKMQELIRERHVYAQAGLDNYQAGFRIRERFGTLTQLWDEFQTFEDDNPHKKALLEWEANFLEDPEWRPPVWKATAR